MLERPLRYLAIVLSLIVALGFILFVVTDAGRASNEQIAHVNEFAADPTPAGERAREKHNSSVHEFIDDANDVLLKPFSGLTDSNSR